MTELAEADAGGSPAQDPARYHEALDAVERDHWWFTALRRLVAETLAEAAPAPARVLDAGCSTGHLLAALPEDYERVGVDASAGAIALARRLRPGIEFQVGSIERLPLATASFDAALATDVVSAVGVADDARAVGELRRVLRPGGALLVQVAAYEWLRSGHDAAAGTARRYTARSLGRLLAEGGFTVAHLTYRVTLPFPAALLWRLARRGAEGSDVVRVAPALNRALAGAMALEHPLALRRRLPFGLSVFAVARADGRRR